jgi:hypothetical protein
MRFNSRRSGGLNLKGAGMKKTIHQYRQMSLLQCTSHRLAERRNAILMAGRQSSASGVAFCQLMPHILKAQVTLTPALPSSSGLPP